MCTRTQGTEGWVSRQMQKKILNLSGDFGHNGTKEKKFITMCLLADILIIYFEPRYNLKFNDFNEICT